MPTDSERRHAIIREALGGTQFEGTVNAAGHLTILDGVQFVLTPPAPTGVDRIRITHCAVVDGADRYACECYVGAVRQSEPVVVALDALRDWFRSVTDL